MQLLHSSMRAHEHSSVSRSVNLHHTQLLQCLQLLSHQHLLRQLHLLRLWQQQEMHLLFQIQQRRCHVHHVLEIIHSLQEAHQFLVHPHHVHQRSVRCVQVSVLHQVAAHQ